MVGREMPQPDFAYMSSVPGNGPWGLGSTRSPVYSDGFHQQQNQNQSAAIKNAFHRPPPSLQYAPATSSFSLPTSVSAGNHAPHAPSHLSRAEAAFSSAGAFNGRPPPGVFAANAPPPNFNAFKNPASNGWDPQGRFSPSDSLDDIMASPNLSDYSLDNGVGTTPPGGKGGKHGGKGGPGGRPQRRPSNRDEFDGPHQFLQRPPPEYVAMQERELPHLPTNLLVQEQDSVLTQVNDRLSQCAYDFVAKYQFPIPLTQDMRPVERPQDREWTEWVYLLKRLATKRRIPARVLYNGQIKQFVTILENSLEMRHAAKHQSRPLKDDRNILQLISAGIQVAKILKDAPAMDYLDKLYVSTEKQIQERAAAAAARFRS
ncbi:hypothetical protein MCOR27_010063 [Pyricularia oryzae]|uniref:Uncharacterized protein n=1 Tax=Pyricularia grisea TaxID=148305 RepID=A0ABQ8NBK7_PYRGI|nr:hypothetical protein MCOR01_011025 [Pyricularia oryzae]KAI6294456.1 hypothetical protein MCOR33_008430 [Pyricularia grisea]KAI6268666.1 hypothetical protein MCOR27_010063 [Pyricularia oryzae]KAI6283046.1 hypothetical protein MCOR26_002589 [Pyricularia oryzae]KAI6315398.1 hypothetical protein MCOR29_007007 [Pyricularia oryzae]